MFNITNDYTPEEEKAIIEGKADIWASNYQEELIQDFNKKT